MCAHEKYLWIIPNIYNILAQEIIESEFLAATASDKLHSTNASTISSASSKPQSFIKKLRSQHDDRTSDVTSDDDAMPSSSAPKRFASKAKCRSKAADTVHPAALAGPSGYLHTAEQVRLRKSEQPRSAEMEHATLAATQILHDNQPASSIEIPIEQSDVTPVDKDQMIRDVSAVAMLG